MDPLKGRSRGDPNGEPGGEGGGTSPRGLLKLMGDPAPFVIVLRPLYGLNAGGLGEPGDPEDDPGGDGGGASIIGLSTITLSRSFSAGSLTPSDRVDCGRIESCNSCFDMMIDARASSCRFAGRRLTSASGL